MLASDAQNPEFMGAHNPDATLSVKLYSRAVQHMFKTEKEGRPIFEDVVYIEIKTPGNDKNIVDRPVQEGDKARFPMHWAHYQNTHGATAAEIGTPLEQWPQITAAQAEELKALKFRTVEHLANASDQNIASIGMVAGMAPMSLRTRAQAFLHAAADSAVPQRQAAELEKLRAEKEASDEQHTKDMAEMRAMIADLAANQKAKPGPKPKAEV